MFISILCASYGEMRIFPSILIVYIVRVGKYYMEQKLTAQTSIGQKRTKKEPKEKKKKTYSNKVGRQTIFLTSQLLQI